jgi:RND family efflux transporter MFP subunit
MSHISGHSVMRLLLACLLSACAAGLAGAQTPPGGAVPRAFGGTPEIRAQLVPRQYTTLSSEMAGRIDTINALVGVKFNKGDLLVAFDCAIQRAQESRAQAEATRAEKALAVNNRLVQLKSSSELELEVAKAELDKAKADLAVAQAMVSKCSIFAPFSGVTVDQKARQFQYAAQGQALLDILDNSTLDVELIAPSRWLTWLKPGFTFDLRIDELNKSYPVKVTRFSGKADPVSQSVRIIGEITAAAPDLIAGMSGRATIQAPPN